MAALLLLLLVSLIMFNDVFAFTNSYHHNSISYNNPNHHNNVSFNKPTTLHAKILPDIDAQTLAAVSSATVTYLSLITYFDRPRGHLSIPDPQSNLIIQQSNVPGAGLGLFAKQSIPKGTVLGSYAGVMRPTKSFYNGKCRQFPQAIGYSWRFTDSKYIIDPTDSNGEIQNVCFGGSSEVPFSNLVFTTLLRFWNTDTMLCRINEPPIGAGGCNVSAKENLEKREVVFELIQDVYAGQELYLDYGLDYDRSRYGPSS